MAKLPSYRRLYDQDFPEKDQELVGQLAVSINAGFEALYETLNGKLSFNDNTASLITTITVEVDASGKPKSKTTIKKNTSDRFSGFPVISAVNLSNSTTYPTSAPFISYTETTNTVTIDNITGLPANNLFQLTIFGIK